MKLNHFALGSSLLGATTAFWRMECRGRVGLARIDPMVSPGEVAQHVHTIHGSSGFSETATYDDVVNADCTSCMVTTDKSVYWSPAVYFKHDNGSYELVPQTGGMLAYYKLNPAPGVVGNITAFPEGFRMIAGDSLRRNYSVGGLDVTQPDPGKSDWVALGQVSQVDLQQRAIGFNCLNYAKDPEPSLYRHYLPEKSYLDANCADGVRIELQFPTCWNGKDLDSTNHRSHVAYADLVDTGDCPTDFPVRLPGLFYETIWETDVFADSAGEFVISNGDIQGFGYHADFIMGWESGVLQDAVDTCTNESGLIADCPVFQGHIQDLATMNQCKMANLPAKIANEKVSGLVGDSLPGDVQIQYGPEPATQAHPGTQTTTVAVPTVSYSAAPKTTTTLPGAVFYELKSSATPSESAATTVAAVAASASAPAPTEAPSSSIVDDQLPIVSTQYVTNGNMVSEVVWKEAVVYVTEADDVTVTVTVQPTSTVQAVRRLRRSGHSHRHVHERR